MISESLDGSFGGIGTMVVGLNKLEFNVLRIEVRVDYYCGLIVHDMQLWIVTIGF